MVRRGACGCRGAFSVHVLGTVHERDGRVACPVPRAVANASRMRVVAGRSTNGGRSIESAGIRLGAFVQSRFQATRRTASERGPARCKSGWSEGCPSPEQEHSFDSQQGMTNVSVTLERQRTLL